LLSHCLRIASLISRRMPAAPLARFCRIALAAQRTLCDCLAGAPAVGRGVDILAARRWR